MWRPFEYTGSKKTFNLWCKYNKKQKNSQKKSFIFGKDLFMT